MAKEVDLLSYWMPLLRQLKEFKEIANTEEPELRYILAAIDRTLANMFIETADEYGIKRYEDMMDIVPDEEDTLDTRRFRVLTLWNDYVPYTKSELYKRLVSICGSESAFELEENYDEYWIKVITHLGVNGAFELLSDTFKEILPCNLVLEFENLLEASKTTPLYVGCVCTTALHYCITHDIEVEAFSPSSANFGVGLSKADTQLITHDKDMKGSLNLSVKSGTGYGMAYTKIITHDIQKRVTNGGKPVVATSANVATTITIN